MWKCFVIIETSELKLALLQKHSCLPNQNKYNNPLMKVWIKFVFSVQVLILLPKTIDFQM